VWGGILLGIGGCHNLDLNLEADPIQGLLASLVFGFSLEAVDAPSASVTGDPWMRFRSIFRAESHLIFKTKSGITKRNIDWGWLKPGRHSIKFGCGRLHGTFRVHVHGKASDGAVQNSPVRKVTC
jgi:hypothetical protein